MTGPVDDVDVPTVGDEVVDPAVTPVGRLEPVGSLAAAAVDEDDRMIVAPTLGQQVLHEQRVQHVDGAVVRALRRVADELAAEVSQLELARFAAGERRRRKRRRSRSNTGEHIRIPVMHS